MKTRIIVVAHIENDSGQILLGRKRPNMGVYPNTWHACGGGLEENEVLEQALRRKVREETGLEIESFEAIPFADDNATKYTDKGAEEIYHIFFPYLVKVKNSTPPAGSDFLE